MKNKPIYYAYKNDKMLLFIRTSSEKICHNYNLFSIDIKRELVLISCMQSQRNLCLLISIAIKPIIKKLSFTLSIVCFIDKIIELMEKKLINVKKAYYSENLPYVCVRIYREDNIKIGLVLHGQGAYGFRHLSILEAFKNLRLKSSVIAQFSINLIIY
ncbi:hypothetical protein HNQ69_000560 [Bartonella callosciuri]|uniref:Uncharacterized protein n=1 Tax=Bartonella callosciuri TaxID=686223 RepID=A0A840NVZ4_9HYPH|nr:hypothetical protein [Bartonella callosciuri]